MAKKITTSAMFVSIITAGSIECGVFFKISPEDVKAGDLVAFNRHDVGRVDGTEDGPRGMITVHYRGINGLTMRNKRRGVPTVALIERDGQQVAQAPEGTPFD